MSKKRPTYEILKDALLPFPVGKEFTLSELKVATEEAKRIKHFHQNATVAVDRLRKEGEIDVVEKFRHGKAATYRRTSPLDVSLEKVFPDSDYVIKSCVSCFVAGATFVLFKGGSSLVLPVNKYVYVGVKRNPEAPSLIWKRWHSGDIIRESGGASEGFELLERLMWHDDVKIKQKRDHMKDEEEKPPTYYEKHVEGIIDWKGYEKFFEVLKPLKITVAFESGIGHGLSVAGSIASSLALTSVLESSGREWADKVNAGKEGSDTAKEVWNSKSQEGSLVLNKANVTLSLMRNSATFVKYLKLCQAYERTYTTADERILTKEFRDLELGMSEYSSGAASLCVSLGRPVLLRLVHEEGTAEVKKSRAKVIRKLGSVDFASTRVLPPVEETGKMALLYDEKGPREMTHAALQKTFNKLFYLVHGFPDKAKCMISSLAGLSSSTSECIADLIEGQKGDPLVRGENRSLLMNLFTMHDAILRATGIAEDDISILQQELLRRGIILSRIGVGGRGTFLLVKLNDMDDQQLTEMINDLQKLSVSFLNQLMRKSQEEKRHREPSWRIMRTLGTGSSQFIFSAEPQTLCFLPG